MPGSAAELGTILAQEASLATLARQVLPTLPGWDPDAKTAPSMADAVALVHAREDAKKKVNPGVAQSKAKRATSRTVSASAAGDRLPGVVQGGGDTTAFWLYVEDYFRDVTAADIATLLRAAFPDPSTDPLLRVPEPGPPPELTPAAPVAPAAIETPTASRPGTAIPSPWAQLAATPVTGIKIEQPDGAATERRSVRLVSRLHRSSTGEEPPPPAAEAATALPPQTSVDEGPPLSATQQTPVVAGSGALSMDREGSAAVAAAAPGTMPSRSTSGLESGRASSATTYATPVGPPAVGPCVTLRCGPAADVAIPPGATCVMDALSAGEVRRLCHAVETCYPRLALEPREKIAKSATDAASEPAARSWLRRVAPDVARESGALEQVLWPLGVPEDGAEEPDRETLRPSLPRKLLRALRDEASAGDKLAVPCGSRLHPYTSRLLGAAVPRHVAASASALPAAGDGPAPLQGSASSASFAPRAFAGGADEDALRSGESSPRTRPQTPLPDETPAAGKTAARGARNGAVLLGAGAGARSESCGNLLMGALSAVNGGGACSPATGSAPPPPVAAAVQSYEADGPVEMPLHVQEEEAMPALMSAPQDEILAEMLALQSELLAQQVANRWRAATALRSALSELDSAAASRAALLQERHVVRAALFAAREERRAASRQRREAAHREAMAQKTSLVLSSPRPVLGRQRGAKGAVHGDKPDMATPRPSAKPADASEPPLLGPNELYDVLAERGVDEEAYCAVCGDGHSEAPNQIVFCERCDLAVHQRCYDIPEVPPGEWLCHPCREYEASRLEEGETAATLRPPRWASSGASPRRLPGGSRDVSCALCPIRLGAFRKATPPDGRWVHAVCALWTPETYLVPGEQAAAVAGLGAVRLRRAPCAICGLSTGSVIACCASGCHYAFHPLCARNLGLYLAVRADAQGRPQYRIYCAVHSGREQEKDQQAWAARQQEAAAAASRDRERRGSLDRLAAAEEARRTLGTLRVDLEQARMLADLTKRRERLKQQLVSLFVQEHETRLRDPALALLRLQAQQAAALQALLLSGAMRHFPAGPLVAAAAQQLSAQAAAGGAQAPGGQAMAQAGAAATTPNVAGGLRAPSPGVDPATAWAALQAQQAQVFARLSQLNSQALLRLGTMGSPARGGAPAAAPGSAAALGAAPAAPASGSPTKPPADGVAAEGPAQATASPAVGSPPGLTPLANPQSATNASAAASVAATVPVGALRSPLPFLPPGLLGFAMSSAPGFFASLTPSMMHVPPAAATHVLCNAASDPATPSTADGGRGAGAGRRGRGAGRGAAGAKGRGATAASQATPLPVPASLSAIATAPRAGGGPPLGNPAAVPPALRIDRERVMTPKEAAAANSLLPPKFKYVPMTELQTPGSKAASPGTEKGGTDGPPAPVAAMAGADARPGEDAGNGASARRATGPTAAQGDAMPNGNPGPGDETVVKGSPEKAEDDGPSAGPKPPLATSATRRQHAKAAAASPNDKGKTREWEPAPRARSRTGAGEVDGDGEVSSCSPVADRKAGTREPGGPGRATPGSKRSTASPARSGKAGTRSSTTQLQAKAAIAKATVSGRRRH